MLAFGLGSIGVAGWITIFLVFVVFPLLLLYGAWRLFKYLRGR